MTTESGERTGRRLCSEVSRAAGDDPGGTGTPFGAYLGIEIPPPWRDDISQSPNVPEGLAEPVMAAWEGGVIGKFTALLPDPEYSVEGHTRVLLYRRPRGPVARFERSEYLLPDGRLVSFAEALSGGLGKLEEFEAYREPDGPESRDLLVCTHGANDVCCGKFGYPVYERLRRHAAESNGSLRVWRTSHIGGHRFAATMIDFPEGRYWGHLEPGDAERVLLRDGPVSELAEKYRGWAAIANGFEQLAERAAFASEGWAWTGYLKSAEVLEESSEGARVRLDYSSPDGGVCGAYEALVEPDGSIMTLGKSGDGPLQEVPQYRVRRLKELTEL